MSCQRVLHEEWVGNVEGWVGTQWRGKEAIYRRWKVGGGWLSFNLIASSPHRSTPHTACTCDARGCYVNGAHAHAGSGGLGLWKAGSRAVVTCLWCRHVVSHRTARIQARHVTLPHAGRNVSRVTSSNLHVLNNFRAACCTPYTPMTYPTPVRIPPAV